MNALPLHNLLSNTKKYLSIRVQEFGFVCLENALDDEIMASLLAESNMKQSSARKAKENDPISYQASLADIGDTALSLLRSPFIYQILQMISDESLALTAEASCYTYYGPGDFLSAHRDRFPECAVTVIVYIYAASPNSDSPNTGLSFRVYNEKSADKSNLRAIISTRVGSLVVGRGSYVWHERPPLQEGEYVTALTACFRALI